MLIADTNFVRMPREEGRNQEFNEMGEVIFGCDKRDAWKRSQDMRSEIEKLFSQHYGPNYDDLSKQVHNNKQVDWEKLGNQLRRKCQIY